MGERIGVWVRYGTNPVISVIRYAIRILRVRVERSLVSAREFLSYGQPTKPAQRVELSTT